MSRKKLLHSSATVSEPRILETRGAYARLSVVSIAKVLEVSRQRAGLLLNDGRIEGARKASIRGTWWVLTPLRLSKGQRGPQAGYHAPEGFQLTPSPRPAPGGVVTPFPNMGNKP